MALAKVVLPVPGGPKRTIACGGHHTMATGQLRMGQRKDDSSFDKLLFFSIP